MNLKKYGLLERCDIIVIIQINSKVALCGGVKEITGKWILTTLYELSPAKKILRNLQTKDFFVKKWQKIEGFPFQVMKKKHHDFTFCFHFVLTF